MGGKAVTAVCSAEDGDAIVKRAIEAFNGVHILIANAGILRDKSFVAMSEKDWDDVLAVHLRCVLSPQQHHSTYPLTALRCLFQWYIQGTQTNVF